MGWMLDCLKSSIGKKLVVGAMGLLLCGFLVIHLIGNLLVLGGPKLFNAYAETLESVPGLLAIELALAAVFLVHILFAVIVWWGDWTARGVGYAVVQGKGGRTIANVTMIYSGAITAVFLAIHVWNVRFATRGEMGLYGVLVHLFKNPAYSVFYVACVCVLGAHVWHGFQSALRTFGVHHPKYTPAVEWISWIFGVVVAAGFSSVPIWVFFAVEGVS